MKTTIWLEIHIKLSTPNKLFCRCANVQNFVDLEPNTHICPICTAQPGALPTVSMECIDKAIQLGRLLKCTIQDGFYFDRKNYFYPDLPMWYQITQLSRPININGQMDYWIDNYKTKKTAKITQAHLENDTAKSIYHEDMTLIDYNRAGTPLVEIVTWPDFHTHEEVVEFLKELQRLIKWNDIWSADLDKGQMRVDVNISVSPDDTLGTRVEVKNINTFASIRNAINFEVARQTELINNGGRVTQETVRRHDPSGQTISMRSKEDAHDYRYFPEPDIRPIHIVDNIYNEDNLTNDQLINTYVLNERQAKELVNSIDPIIHDTIYKQQIYGKNQVYFFGDKHITDYDDLQYKDMLNFANNFLEKNKWKKNIILVEWCKWIAAEKILSNNSASATQTYVKFAVDNKLERSSAEPKFSEELEYIINNWIPNKDYAYYYIARTIAQRYRWWQIKSIEEYLDTFMNKDIRFESILWKKYSLELFRELHNDIFKEKLDLNNETWFKHQASPNNWWTINKASNMSWYFRDLYISKKVLEYLDQWYNVLMAFGRFHHVVQKPIYDKYFEQQIVKSDNLSNIYIPADIISQMLDWWFNKEYINWLIQNQDVYIYFASLVDKWTDPKIAAKRIVWSLMSYCVNSDISTSQISLEWFENFVQDVTKYNLKDTNAKLVLETMITENISSQDAIAKHGFDKVEELDYVSLACQVIAANPQIADEYRGGKLPVMAFLVWQMMRLSWGKSDAQIAKQTLETELTK